jgi:hypothetical protein
MKRSSGGWLFPAIAALSLSVLSGCTSPNDAGKDVLPADEQVSGHYLDTFSIFYRTLRIDSTNTYKLSTCLFGNYLDEQFGHISAETYIQPRVSGSNLTFGPDPQALRLDSLVLTLDLVDFYGRYSDPITLQIHEVTEPFPKDSSLNSQSRLSADTLNDLSNGYTIDFSRVAGFYDFIGIRLDDALGNKILHANTDNLISNEAFTAFFKGLYIRSLPVSPMVSREPGGVFAFDPRSEKSFMKLHYHDGATPKTVTFPINANSERFHAIHRTDWQGRLIHQSILQNGDPNQTYGCIEAGALTNLHVSIPGLRSLHPAIINQATLVLKVDREFMGSLERFRPPVQVFLFIADSTHSRPANPSLPNSTGDFVKATYEYRIPITNTVQQILSGKLADNGFIIIPGENGISLNRAVLGGPGHPALAPRLEVIYTTLPKH